MNNTYDFLKPFVKEVTAMKHVSTTAAPPRFWFSTGNYVLNKILSGRCDRGIPQGRITHLAGPSSTGKSYIATNVIKHAQLDGAITLAIDSENALDDEFVTKIGVDTSKDYYYTGVVTIADTIAIMSSFLKCYREEYGTDVNAPKVLIVTDSLNMLLTETELEHYLKGVQKGDQGQKNKQLKSMLQQITQDIKELNVAVLCTSQVYKNQDILNGEGVWIVSEAVKYSASQIALLTKRKLKDSSAGAKAGDVAGVRIIAEGYKTRFTKPYQKVEIEVPYDTGMDPYSGLLEVGLGLNLVVKHGNRYRLSSDDELWFSKDIGGVADELIKQIDNLQSAYLITDAESDTTVDEETDTKKRQQKIADMIANKELSEVSVSDD